MISQVISAAKIKFSLVASFWDHLTFARLI